MRYCSLMSGSWGNSHYISSKNTHILVDVGQSGKRILANMHQAGCCDANNLSAILVTHAHRDHAIGVGIFARKFKLPIYATAGTWYEMKPLIGEIPTAQQKFISTEEQWQIQDLTIESFPTSHDAIESVGYVIRDDKVGLGIATDCGVFTIRMQRYLNNLNGLVLEANHDIKLLRDGRYPIYLKKRIAGVQGHLSNEDAANGLKRILGSQTKQVILAHLSQENNTPELAIRSFSDIIDSNIKVSVSPRCIPGEWMEL